MLCFVTNFHNNVINCYSYCFEPQDAREALAAVRGGTHTAELRVMSDPTAAASAAEQPASLLQQRSVQAPPSHQRQQQQQHSKPDHSVQLQQQQQLLQQATSLQESQSVLASSSSGGSSSSSRLPEIKIPWQVGTTLSALSVVPERGRPDHAVLWVALNRKIEWHPTWEPGSKSEMAVTDKVGHALSLSIQFKVHI
jgi:hypothetical protein